MLNFAFFCAVFSSASWLIYAVLYIRSQALDGGLFSQSPDIMLSFLAIVLAPVLLIWLVFGFLNQYLGNHSANEKQTELLRQLQKNQDYTDLVVRVMLEAEHEIKDGFVINKFDTFIADMNESLSDIIQRCNIASSAQLEQLWLKVQRGEKWALGKAVIEAAKNQSTFNAWMEEKVGRDKVFRGSLLEFCSRYQNLLQLLEKHDRDRVFLRVIETGVFGKVYSIIAPISEGLRTSVDVEKSMQPEPEKDYSSVLKIATMEEPKAPESIVNVDKDVEEETTDDLSAYAPKESFFSRLNPFKKNDDDYLEHSTTDDPFFKALHNSFSNDEDINFEPENKEVMPELNVEPQYEEEQKDDVRFTGVAETLQSLRATNEEIEKDFVKNEPTLGVPLQNDGDDNDEKKSAQDEDDFVYPFGGWSNEENYKR